MYSLCINSWLCDLPQTIQIQTFYLVEIFFFSSFFVSYVCIHYNNNNNKSVDRNLNFMLSTLYIIRSFPDLWRTNNFNSYDASIFVFISFHHMEFPTKKIRYLLFKKIFSKSISCIYDFIIIIFRNLNWFLVHAFYFIASMKWR